MAGDGSEAILAWFGDVPIDLDVTRAREILGDDHGAVDSLRDWKSFGITEIPFNGTRTSLRIFVQQDPDHAASRILNRDPHVLRSFQCEGDPCGYGRRVGELPHGTPIPIVVTRIPAEADARCVDDLDPRELASRGRRSG
jgi:hypothetical protein